MGRERKPLVVMVALLAAAALLTFSACQRDDANRGTLTITGPVHVYKTEVPPPSYPGTDFIAVLGPGDHPKILEVKSQKGYRAVKIRLADGRAGWVFSGEAIDIP